MIRNFSVYVKTHITEIRLTLKKAIAKFYALGHFFLSISFFFVAVKFFSDATFLKPISRYPRIYEMLRTAKQLLLDRQLNIICAIKT